MFSPPSPFAWYNQRSYLVVNFDIPPTDLPGLQEMLERLLAHHPADQILLLRPLSTSEAALLRQAMVERDREAWAQMVVEEEDRYRGK
jgi:hypothetical protein